MILSRRNLTFFTTLVTTAFLAVGLFSDPSYAVAKRPSSNVLFFELTRDSSSKTGSYVELKHTGGPIKNAQICWESTSYCVALTGDGSGGWVATFKVSTKVGQMHKAVLYYNIDGYSFKHVLKTRVVIIEAPNPGGR